MRKLFKFAFASLCLSVCFASTKASAQTYVPSKITANTTWKAVNGPYVIAGIVSVNAGVTLTIEPGTVVKLGPTSTGVRGALSVQGVLNAVGTSEKRITFTSIKDDSIGGDTGKDGASTPAAGDWYRIGLLGPKSKISYANVFYGGNGLRVQANAAVESNSNADHQISFSNIYYSQTSGVFAYRGSITVSNCSIANNGGGVSNLQGNVTVSNSNIVDNAKNGVDISLSSYTGPASVFNDNEISRNGGTGVFLYTKPDSVPASSQPRGSQNNIYNNQIPNDPADPYKEQLVSAFYVPQSDWSNNFWGRVDGKALDVGVIKTCGVPELMADATDTLVYFSTFLSSASEPVVSAPNFTLLKKMPDGTYQTFRCFKQYVKTDLPAANPFARN